MRKAIRQRIIQKLLSFLFITTTYVGYSQTYSFESWSNTNTAVMTVPAFRSVTVDRSGKVWVGSDLGGLYCYRESQWVKINTYPDITFRHLVPSNMPLDSNVWATSIGKTGVQATSGGAYLINTKTETVTQYGSGIAGGLSSRYGNSLALSSQGEVFVALAQSTTAGVTNQGGVYKTKTVNPPAPSTTSFTKAIVDQVDIIYHSAGNRGEEMWFGRGANCASGCQAPYIARLSSTGAELPAITAAFSGLPFTATSTSSFPRAIFTDSTWGNTFVGLNSGGVGVCKADGKWKMLTSANSPFPAGAAVNFNAITEVFGEVWIGTTSGIFVYDGNGDLDNPSSFKMLTTTNGLPSNIITDIAVDTARSDIWITTPIGVSRCHFVPPYISGFAFDVSAGAPVKDEVPKLFAKFKTDPIWYDLTVKLYDNATLVDEDHNTPYGKFVLYGPEGKNYKVVLEYKTEDGLITYEYANIKAGTFMGGILLPKTLKREIKGFAPFLESREFTQDLPFKIPYTKSFSGFLLNGYNNSYSAFLPPNKVLDNHLKRVQNLGDFYATMATAYKFGGDAYKLKLEAANITMDCLFAAAEIFDFFGTLKSKTADQQIVDILLKMRGDLAKNLKDAVVAVLTKIANSLDDESAKEAIKTFVTIFSDAMDTISNFSESGFVESVYKLGIEFIKKAAAAKYVSGYYTEYCRKKHESLISFSSVACYNIFSPQSYELSYSKLYGTLAKSVDDIKKTAEDQTVNLTLAAKLAENSSKIASVTARVLAATPLFEISPALLGVSKALTIVRLPLLAQAAAINSKSSSQVVIASYGILSKAGFVSRPTTETFQKNKVNGVIPTQHITALISSKNVCNSIIVDLKAIYNATYNQPQFLTKLSELAIADSVYSNVLRMALQNIWSTADSANTKIPGFATQLDNVVDTFVDKQFKYRDGFYYSNLAYLYATDKNNYIPSLIQQADSILLLNDSTVNSISRITDSIVSRNIQSQAYLVKDEVKLNHNHLYGAPGNVSYKFTNYGGEAMQQVSFKINTPTAGYAITGNDSIFVGTINPGQTVSILFNFSTPAHDSVSTYDVFVYAANGIYSNITGTLFAYDPSKFYTIRDGNWSSPETWSTGMVPIATSVVEVGHKIVVDVDASCKSLKNAFYGTVTVSPGKNLIILQ